MREVFKTIAAADKFVAEKVANGAILSGNFPSVASEGKYDGSLDLIGGEPQFIVLGWTDDKKVENLASGAIMTLNSPVANSGLKPVSGIFVTLIDAVKTAYSKKANYAKTCVVDAKKSKTSGKIYCSAKELN